MPTKRTRRPRYRHVLSESERAWLFDEPEPAQADGGDWFARFRLDGPGDEGAARELWREHRDDVLSWWARERPGTRPINWWRFDAPRVPKGAWPSVAEIWLDGTFAEPRRRLGGSGTPKHEVTAHIPFFDRGVPVLWFTAEDYETRRQLEDGTYPCVREGSFVREHLELTAPPYDPDDPPIYESEAAYLERHGLLLPGERERLSEADFEPERVEIETETD